MNSIVEHKNKVYTLIGVGLAMFLGALDQTIVTTALPRVVAELGGLDRYTWVTTVYLLVSTLLVPVYGKLSDIMNRKTLELWSVSTFLIGSALCGLAGEWGSLPVLGDGMNQLIVFRAVQGLGGAGLFALAFIIISDLYPPRERGKVGGMFGAVFGLSSVIGPLIGGFLTDNAGAWLPPIEGWRWVFYVNVPIGALALWFIITRMPRLHPKDNSHEFDLVSAGLMMATFLPLILALQLDKSINPWTGPLVLSLLAAAAVFLALWIYHSLKLSKHPILDLRLFRNRVFLTGTISGMLFGAGFLSLIIFLPLYMVNVQQVSAMQAGISIIPLTLGVVLGAGLGGPVASKLGRYKGILVVGSLVAFVASLLIITLGLDTPYWLVVIFMFIAGVGFGPAQSLYSLAVQNAVPPHEIGQATSFSQFSRQIGSTVGAAIMGAIFSAALTTSIATHLPAGAGGSAMHRTQGEMAAQGPVEIRQEMRLTLDRQFAPLIDGLKELFRLPQPEAVVYYQKLLADPQIPAKAKEELNTYIGDPAGYTAEKWDNLSGPSAEMMVSGMAKLKDQIVEGVVNGIRNAFAEALRPVWWTSAIVMLLLILGTLTIPNLPLRERGQKPVEDEPVPPAGH